MAAGRAAAERAASAQANEMPAVRPHAPLRRGIRPLRTTALAALVLAACLAQPALAEEGGPGDRDAGGAATATTVRGFGGVISIQAVASGAGKPGDAARPSSAGSAPSPALGGAFASIASSAERLAEINERIVDGPGDALAGVIADAMTGVERGVVDHASQVRDGRDELPAPAPSSPAEPDPGGSRDDGLVIAPAQTPPDGVAGGAPGDSALLPRPVDPEVDPDRGPRAPDESTGVETPPEEDRPEPDRAEGVGGEAENPLPEGAPKDDPAAPGGSGADDRERPDELPGHGTPPREHADDAPAEPSNRGESRADAATEPAPDPRGRADG